VVDIVAGHNESSWFDDNCKTNKVKLDFWQLAAATANEKSLK